MTERRPVIIWVHILVLLAAAGAVAQEVAYVVLDGPFLDAELNRVDLRTGALTPVGPVGGPVTQIAFDADGSLLGIDAEGGLLLTLDPSTGAGAPVGALGTAIDFANGLTVDGDGRVWMTASDSVSGPSLFEIDPVSGVAQWRHPMDWASFGALASVGNDVFVANYSLSVIDTSTGQVSPVPGSHLEIWTGRALDADDNGNLWGLLLCGPCMMPFDLLIITGIDPVTGLMAEESATQPHGTWGLAILPGGIFVDGFETGDLRSWLQESNDPRYAGGQVAVVR